MMPRALLALLLAAAPAAVAIAQTPATGDWTLAEMPGGCMVYSNSGRGTVVSVWGFTGQEKLGFLIQNRSWESLREGQRYKLKVGFDSKEALPVEATGRTDIDDDGPGLFFTVTPGGNSEGSRFVNAFTSAKGMEISSDGVVESVPLLDSRRAMTSLAGCLSEQWKSAAPGDDPGEPDKAPVVETI